MRTGIIWVISVVLLVFLVAAALFYRGPGTSLTDAEATAISEISGVDAAGFTDISGEVISKDIAKKFPAVSKIHRFENLYAFIVEPVAYNGPIKLALVIDGSLGESIGLRVIEHEETLHYVRDMEQPWFMDRFAGKTVFEYLTMVRLRAQTKSDIVAITGATVTTEGVINGVNSAFGVFQESILGRAAEAVPYRVRFEPGQSDGPEESESLAIRAYGVVLAEVSLEEIRALPSVRRTMSIHSTAGISQHSFRGTLLSNILSLVSPELMEQYEWVVAIGVDDYISGINMGEVKAENSVFVMYGDNDEPLLKRNGEPGALRIVVIDDVFGQRFTNFLLEIVLENETGFPKE